MSHRISNSFCLDRLGSMIYTKVAHRIKREGKGDNECTNVRNNNPIYNSIREQPKT